MAELKYPLSLVIRAVDRVTGPLQTINTKLERTTSRLSAPFRRLSGRLAALSNASGLPKVVAGFHGVGTAAGAVGSQIMGVGKAIAGMVTGALFGGLGLYTLVRGAEAAGSRLNDLSTVTGLSVNSFAELEFAAKLAGVENEAFAGGMTNFNRSLSEARRGMGKLHSTLKDDGGGAFLRQLKSAKSNEEAFVMLAKAMEKLKDPGKRAVLAAAAFGKAGVGMVNALKDGPEGVAAMRAEYRRLVGDQEAFAKNADKLGDALDNLELSMSGLRNVAAGALSPAMTKLSEAATKLITDNRDKIQKWAEDTGAAIAKWVDDGGIDRLVTGLGDLKETVEKAVDKFGGLGNVLGAVAVAMAAPMISASVNLAASLVTVGKDVLLLSYRMGTVLLGTLGRVALGMLAFNFGPLLAGLGAATTATRTFTAALLTNPIGIAAALFATAAYLIYTNWGPISGFILDLWQTVKFYTREAWDWISEKIAAVSSLVVTGVMSAWEPIREFFSGLWDGITDVFRRAWAAIEPIVGSLIAGVQMIPGLAMGGAQKLAGAADLGVFGGNTFVRSQPLGAERALPGRSGQGGGEARVQVDFANLPRGARVTAARENTAPLDLNLGYSMVGP
jgi:hypothetical protein